MGEFETLSVKLNKNVLTLEEVDKRAAELEMNRSQFVTMALQMMLNFDNELWKKIQKYGEGLHIPEWLIIQNMLIKRFAEEAAENQVWERKGRLLVEFSSIRDQNGVRTLTGEELFNDLKARYVQTEEKKRIEVLLKKESYGVQLRQDEKKLLIKHRSGKAWSESDECKKIMVERARASKFVEEAKKDGLVEEGLEFDDSDLEFVSTLINSNMSKKTIIEQILVYMEDKDKPFETSWED